MAGMLDRFVVQAQCIVETQSIASLPGYGNEKIGRKVQCPSALYWNIRMDYLFTLNFSLPFLMKSTICFAAAMPALVLASVVCAPIFLGVEK